MAMMLGDWGFVAILIEQWARWQAKTSDAGLGYASCSRLFAGSPRCECFAGAPSGVAEDEMLLVDRAIARVTINDALLKRVLELLFVSSMNAADKAAALKISERTYYRKYGDLLREVGLAMQDLTAENA